MRKRILTEDDLRDIKNSIENIDINQFDAIDKGNQNFNTLREPGVFRLWNSSTSPCGTSAYYIMAVYRHNNNVIQVAHSSTSASSTKNKVYVRSYHSGTWSSWRELTNTEIDRNIDEIKDILNSKARTSTIVIANYDSHENSKKGADIVINRGENAAKKINDAIQSLKGTGGEVKLMEGNYNLGYGIAINVDGVHLTGIPNATILKMNNTSADVIKVTVDAYISNITTTRGRYGLVCWENSQIINCTSNNSGSSGFVCRENSQIINCTSNDSGSSGFICRENSQIINCTSNNSGDSGFVCWENSQIINCTSNNSDTGFTCWDNSQITNCTSNNHTSSGFNCTSSFKGVVANNILKNDTFKDDSTSSAIVKNNVIWRGE